MSPGLRLTRRVTVVSTKRAVGWQPLHDSAPGGASAGPAARAWPIDAESRAAAVTMRVRFMSDPPQDGGRPSAARFQAFRRLWFFSGSERRRLPVAAKTA